MKAHSSSWRGVAELLLLLPDFEDVLVTFVCLLRKNPEAQFWTTYQVRRYGCC